MPHMPARLLILAATAALGALSLCLIACGASSDSTESDADAQRIEVTITDDGCDPTDLKATASSATFVVTNDDSAVNNEFEILDGEAIIGEEENVTEGLSAEVSVDLEAGTYDIVCGNPGDREPTGELTVGG